jgi:branched-subunit amino acid aminotransferase/4-amino-4-deoxychorismate lyase
MKYKGEPNEMLSMSHNGFQFKFDENGIFDTTKFLKDFENKVLIPRLDLHRKRVEDDSESIKCSEEVKEKIYTCKTCGQEIEGMGAYLAHCRAHKKEGDS